MGASEPAQRWAWAPFAGLLGAEFRTRLKETMGRKGEVSF